MNISGLYLIQKLNGVTLFGAPFIGIENDSHHKGLDK
jgi:hypothetical protein